MRIEELYQCFLTCSGVSTDTRNIQPNSLFFALKGENFDANTFAKKALENGAQYVVMDNKQLVVDEEKMLYVPDTLLALQDLAKYHREQLGLPIIALTGSNGKTTTKELMLTVLSKKYHTVATKGNLNNHIGVPLTILAIPEDADIAIVEMGANHQKEIETLCAIAQPDYGYITNFGRAHLEGFGGFEGVVKGKRELYDYLRAHHKMVFVNSNDALQVEKTAGMSTYTFSIESPQSTVVFQQACAQPMAEVAYKNTTIRSQLTGVYNIPNICAAIAVGTFFDVDTAQIKQAIENYTSTNNRSQWVQKKDIQVLMDAYNANPSSMKAAIDNFSQLEGENKWCVLGDMFELGTDSPKEHAAIVDLVKEAKLPAHFIGQKFYECKENNSHLHFYATFDDFVQSFAQISIANTTLLIKGSRGMALERVLELLP